MEKKRLPAATRKRLIRALDNPRMPCRLAALALVSREEVPDLPDRIVAVTALALGVPLVSRDRKILASRVRTIW